MAILLFLAYVIFTLVALYRSMVSPVWEVVSVVYLVVATWVVGMPWFVALPLWLKYAEV